MNDSAFLNHFQSFNGNGQAPATQYPLLPTTGAATASGPAPAGLQAQPDAATQALASQIRSQQDAINSINATVNHLAQMLSAGYGSTPATSNQQSQSYQPREVISTMPQLPAVNPNATAGNFSTADDIKNAWALTNRASNKEAARRKVITLANDLSLASTLPAEAKEWAQQHGIALAGTGPKQYFTTSAQLREPEQEFLNSAAQFASYLNEPDDLFYIYGLVKSKLSHLSADTLVQVMSDFSAVPGKPEVLVEAAAVMDQPDLQLDEEVIPAASTEPSAESSNSVDQSLWSTAEALAKRREDQPSRESIEQIYNLLLSASSSTAQESTEPTPEVHAEVSPENTTLADDLNIFADPQCWDLAVQDTTKRFIEPTSRYAASFALQSYRRTFKARHGTLDNAFTLSQSVTSDQLIDKAAEVLSQSLAAATPSEVHEDASAEIESSPQGDQGSGYGFATEAE